MARHGHAPETDEAERHVRLQGLRSKTQNPLRSSGAGFLLALSRAIVEIANLGGGVRESDLYQDIRDWLVGPEFTPVRARRSSRRELKGIVTASTRWLDDGGDWLRPDVTLLHVGRRLFGVAPDFDVYAIEVKADVSSLTSGLYQSLAYSRMADFCYLAAPDGPAWTTPLLHLAERFGVGLIRIGDPKNWGTYVLTKGERMTPDPDLRDLFVDSVLADPLDREDVLRALDGRQ